MDSDILSAESPDFRRTLAKWLPVTGNWSVCWRATRDGYDSKIFHQRCDSKVPTLTVVNVLKNNKSLIFGGFGTAKWAVKEGLAASAPGSFLFSLRNNDNLPPFKSPLINPNRTNAMLRDAKSGPKFGIGPDLSIADGSIIQGDAKSVNVANLANLGYSYQAPPGYTKDESKTRSLLGGNLFFIPVEVEVLYLN